MSEKRLIDTNLVIRHLVGDNVSHAKAAEKVFAACDRGEITLVLLPTVLSECVFVLESFYKHPRIDIAGVLKTLIGSPGVYIEDESRYLDALDRYVSSGAHFVDCVLAAFSAATKVAVISFDRDFRKFRDVELIDPVKDW